MQIEEVERIAAIAPRDFAARVERDERPLVITGGVRHWPAVARWSPTYLKERIGSAQVRVKVSRSNVHPDFNRPTLAETFAVEAGTFASFIDRITTGPREERARRLFTGDEQFLLR